jgi:hypothetical protein
MRWTSRAGAALDKRFEKSRRLRITRVFHSSYFHFIGTGRGAFRDTRREKLFRQPKNATGDRNHCLPGEILAMRDHMHSSGDGKHATPAGMNTTADRMHCPPGEIHAMRDGINATADRIYLLRQHVNATATSALRFAVE